MSADDAIRKLLDQSREDFHKDLREQVKALQAWLNSQSLDPSQRITLLSAMIGEELNDAEKKLGLLPAQMLRMITSKVIATPGTIFDGTSSNNL